MAERETSAMEPDMGTTSLSSDEEDVHQCGRCKAVFHNIDTYFSHKRARSCSRSRRDTTLQLTEPASLPKPLTLVTPPGVTATSTQSAQGDRDESIESQSKSDIDTENVVRSGFVGRIGRGRRRKAAPKKAWVEDYRLGMEQNQPAETSLPHTASGSTGLTLDSQPPSKTPATAKGTGTHGRGRGSSRGSSAQTFTRMSLRLRKRGQVNPDTSNAASKVTEKQVDLDFDYEINPKQVTKVVRGRYRGRGIHRGHDRGRGRGQGRGRGRGHMIKAEEDAPATIHSCPMCDYHATYKEEYDRHLRRVHNLSNYVCPNCKRPFRDKYKLNRHINNKQCKQTENVLAETPNFVEFSKKLVPEGYMQWDKSRPVTMGEDSNRNKDVPEGPKKDTLLTGDNSTHQPKSGIGVQDCDAPQDEITATVLGKAINFSCNECDIVCPTYDSIMEHLKEHPNIFPGICRFCGHWFPSKYKLWRHMTSSVHDAVTDTELQQAKDDIRGLKIFWTTSAKNKLRLREMRHRISCNKCSKVFSKKEHFERHIQAIHGSTSLVQRFECDSCGSKFAKRSFLMCHLQKEHGIEDALVDNFQCPVCMKSFRQKNHVYRHRESLHTAVPQVPSSEVFDVEGGPLPEDEDYIDMDHPKSEKLYTCFVCRNTVTTRSRYYFHLQVHRVWAVLTPNGPRPDLVPKIFDSLYNNLPPALAAQLGMVHVLGSVTETSTMGAQKQSDEGQNNSANTSCVTSLPNEDDCIGQMVDAEHVEKGISTDQLSGQEEARNEQQSVATPQLSTIDQNAFRDLVQEHAVFSMLQEMESKMAAAQHEATLSDAHGMQGGDPETTTQFSSVVDGRRIDLATGEMMGDNVLSPADDQQRILDALANGQDVDSAEEFGEDPDSSGPQKNSNNDSETEKPKQSNSTDDAKKFLCPYCLKLFNSLLDCYQHKVSEHGLVAVFVCVHKNCGLVFSKAVDYEAHALEHTQRAFICQVCNEHYKEMLPLVAHKSSAHRSLHSNGSFRCGACNKVFGSKEALTEHVAKDQHHHQCSHCNKVLKSQSELRDHLLRHQGIRSFLCDICGTTFVNKLSLNRHRALHKPDRLHKCEHCQKTFAKREHLRRHVVTKHMADKPFVCPHCGKGFKRKDKLQEHFRTHSDVKPFVCQYCAKSYRYREGLKYHEKTHQRELKHFCSMCNTGFPRPGQLRVHMKQAHSVTLKENSSYPCPQCPMCFSRPERVKRHMEREHNVDANWQFKCVVCSRGFAGEKSLQTHMAKRHINPLSPSVQRPRPKPVRARLGKEMPPQDDTGITLTTEHLPGRSVDPPLTTTIQLPSGAMATIAMSDLVPGAQLQQMLPLPMTIQQVAISSSLPNPRPITQDTITFTTLTSQAEHITPCTLVPSSVNATPGLLTSAPIQTTSSLGYLTSAMDQMTGGPIHMTPTGPNHLTSIQTQISQGPGHLTSPGPGQMTSDHMTPGPLTPSGSVTPIPSHMTPSPTVSLGASSSSTQANLLQLANASHLGLGKNEIPIQVITSPITSDTVTSPCTPQASTSQMTPSWAVSPAQLQAYEYFQLNGALD